MSARTTLVREFANAAFCGTCWRRSWYLSLPVKHWLPPADFLRKALTFSAEMEWGALPLPVFAEVQETAMPRPLSYEQPVATAVISPTCICGSGHALGSRTIAPEDVDRAFGMPVGKLRRRAGIESLA